ncbi:MULTISPECIES: sugar diacid recognition domain-containing protein [Oceanobacillus]|uniref:Carbohydrate diacid regulator n=1 Tax=Oceanobacillus kimchii TaxID=746691 RepID=A0ABQ5TM92_9BACI|nr:MULTISPECIES: sugar diacid recognition domain-containing protein [Oceanobacillus]MBT2600391.1 helix-turn-helix domain-containing protein [Oceanobacillus sp. ISL-74]MBT2650549.1 helix-turn-helix domain-containing protein [Oceanobacillus sp. ISL-73]MCT1578290.1 helix-turn-helix domain-containing protein [Oceanobacillus kimchii]MCT2134468.1 helix-turn-helix domain-containing protein [Oceanobacillus kimchii]GLO67441.1 carbohydrate diacid regulator [Oceanobacillus kimchii]
MKTILTEQLANEIVKRTMSIIHANINIMDQTGTIIASGVPSRIGQLHDGAVQVIKEKHTIEIDTSRTNHWHSSQPGINLPITFQENIVGVIGITGHPDDIRDYSQLIQMGAELTLEQAFLTNEIQQNKQIRQNQITNILLGTEQDQTYIQERAHYAKLDIKTTYAVIIISTPVLDKKHTKDVEKHIHSWLNQEDEYIPLFTNQHLILKKEIQPSSNTPLKDILIEKHKTSAIPHMTIAVGPYLTGVNGWRQSYQEAQKIIEVANTLYPSGGVWSYQDLNLAILTYDLLKNTPQSTKQLIATYHRILTENDGTQLHQTLKTYIEENGKMSITSDKLFIHRNTLTYRLDKIYQITGKDPRNINHLLELKMAQLLYKLESNNN